MSATAQGLDAAVCRLERASSLDRLAEPVADAVARVTHRPPLASALSGTWLGHALHPALTDLPIGSWTSAFVLDLFGGRSSRRAAQLLVGLGVVSAVPAAVTGLADWADTNGSTRRIGLGHALINSVGLACYAASWSLRKRGRHGAGVVAGLVGATAATAAAHLGGHLVYRVGIGVDRNVFESGPEDWVQAEVRSSDDAAFTYLVAGEHGMLATRRSGHWSAIDARCSHLGGPLQEGDVQDGCVVCPWHGSAFRLGDGEVVEGPATAALPRYEVREEHGRFEVRRSAA